MSLSVDAPPGNYLGGSCVVDGIWSNGGVTTTLTQTLAGTLQNARRARRISQMELSLRVGVSQRHVSFVEKGRSRPSRELLLAWLRALGTPLAVQNEAMLQAGYAPVYTAAAIDDPRLEPATEAISQLLRAHDPMPALLLDPYWNVLSANGGARWLATMLTPAMPHVASGATVNMLDLLAHPEGFAAHVVNLREVAPVVLEHLQAAASTLPALASKVQAVAERMRTQLGALTIRPEGRYPGPPVLTTRFRTPVGELAFFSMFTTFGTPQDITLASLRVEHMFAADDATRALLRAHVDDRHGHH